MEDFTKFNLAPQKLNINSLIEKNRKLEGTNVGLKIGLYILIGLVCFIAFHHLNNDVMKKNSSEKD
jgi:hypothetical protein